MMMMMMTTMIEWTRLPARRARVRVNVPKVPVSFMASVVPKHSDNGRRSLRRFDHLAEMFRQPVAGEFLTDSGDELNGARLRELAGSDVELAGSEVACRSGKTVDVMSSELRKTASGGVDGNCSDSSASQESS